MDGKGIGQNRVELSGTVVEREALRHTPAGVPVLQFRIAHASRQTEAGHERETACEVEAVALGDSARMLQAAGAEQALRVAGFLAAKRRGSRQTVLHVTEIEFI